MSNTVLEKVLGVCCSCQTPAPVRVRGPLTQEERDREEDPITHDLDVESLYLMDEHRVAMIEHGVPMCEGEGTVPQSIVRK